MEVLTVITRRAQLEFSNGKLMEKFKGGKERLSFDGSSIPTCLLRYKNWKIERDWKFVRSALINPYLTK